MGAQKKQGWFALGALTFASVLVCLLAAWFLFGPAKGMNWQMKGALAGLQMEALIFVCHDMWVEKNGVQQSMQWAVMVAWLGLCLGLLAWAVLTA